MSNLDAQFFVQLADQAVFRRFSGLHLAAGKLPQPRQLLALRPFADQHPAIGVDQGRGGDEQDLGQLR